MTTKELLQQALDALLPHSSSHGNSWRAVEDAAIDALKQAIAQEQEQEQEIVRRCKTCKSFAIRNGGKCRSCDKDYCNWEPKP